MTPPCSHGLDLHPHPPSTAPSIFFFASGRLLVIQKLPFGFPTVAPVWAGARGGTGALAARSIFHPGDAIT